MKGSVLVKGSKIDFILEEEDTKFDCKNDKFQLGEGDYFAQMKVLRLMLFSETEQKWPEVLTFFDDVLMDVMEESDIERLVSCIQCKEEEVYGYFSATRGFQPAKKLAKCSKGKHEWDQKTIQTDPENSRDPCKKPSVGHFSEQSELSGSQPVPEKKGMGWKYALVISNDQYTPDSGFPVLTSTKEDF